MKTFAVYIPISCEFTPEVAACSPSEVAAILEAIALRVRTGGMEKIETTARELRILRYGVIDSE